MRARQHASAVTPAGHHRRTAADNIIYQFGIPVGKSSKDLEGFQELGQRREFGGRERVSFGTPLRMKVGDLFAASAASSSDSGPINCRLGLGGRFFVGTRHSQVSRGSGAKGGDRGNAASPKK